MSTSSPLDIGTKFHFHDGAMTVQRTQDCDPIAEHAKRLHNDGHHGSSEMRHAACLPFVIVEQYCNLNGITFHECMADKSHVRRMLNDPDLAAFRIWKGRV